MKYISTSIAIVGIWVICAATIVLRESASPITLLFYATVNTVMLALFGFQRSRLPEDNDEEE